VANTKMMFTRITAYLLSIAAVLSLVCLQVDMSHGSEDYSERKEIRAYETGMSSRNNVPFSKFDPRSKTAQHIHRTAGGESDVEGLFPQHSSVFSAFICECIGSFPRYHSAQVARKEKIFILNQVFRI
jgi:hypothetical protein